MPAKDGRRNALVKNQQWNELVYIDSMSMDQYIEAMTRGKKFTVYGFSGQSTQCTLRIDWDKDSNANLIGDFFVLLDQIKDNSVDVFIVDPIFEIMYNPNPAVWAKAINDERLPRSTHATGYVGHPNKWQADVFKKVKPGGMMISKRDIRNTNVLSKEPQMFYVHDARPMAYIVRIDQK